MISQTNNKPADSGRVPAGSHQRSGIMVISSNRQVLYLNKAGRNLLLRLNATEKGSAADGLPKLLAALLDEIQASREVPIEDRGWRRFSLKRLVHAQGQSLSVHAFAQGQQPHSARDIIVLTMHSSDGA